MDCLFCKICQGEIPANIIYQNDEIMAFDDIRPKAPVHKLIIPRKHIATINDINPEDAKLVGDLVIVAKKLAQDAKIAESGYRLIFNCNKDAGQEVFHIHLHLLGGRDLHWPPG